MSTIKNIFRSLFSKDNPTEHYQWKPDAEGVNFFISKVNAEKIKNNQASLWLTNQHIILNMLAEQGQAEIIPNGFIVSTSTVVNLDETSKEALELPSIWNGHIKASFSGQTFKNSFSIDIKLETSPTKYTGLYKIIGPILEVSGQHYLQTPQQALVFSALENHQRSNHNEVDNLQLVMAIQEAQSSGINITLPVFDKMSLIMPNKVTISIEIDENGNLLLTPNLGQKATHEKMQQALAQLRPEGNRVIRVGNEIILLDEKRLKAIHEILKNRKVPKDKIKDFYRAPSIFIDASLIELDVGFSARVKGATYFKHAYFGEIEESGVDWFQPPGDSTPPVVLPITRLIYYITDEEDFREIQQKWNDAKQVGAQLLTFKKLNFDITYPDAVEQALYAIRIALINGELPQPDDGVDKPPTAEGTTEEPPTEGMPIDPPDNEPNVIVAPSGDHANASIVINSEENDDTLTFDIVSEQITKISYPTKQLDWSSYIRQPYPHQEDGIGWIVGLAMDGLNKNKKQWGGLLADDMGLGKTYMALAAIDQLVRIRQQPKEQCKPCLVIAPLSVLQNWKDEVDTTFSTSPFNDIVILQSDSDMRRFRIGGKETKQELSNVETEQDLPEDGDLARVRYSLKVGDSYNFDDRLDCPKRLVITTYQTLRDYQFSLCKINWQVVIFDEAQNIKNPNAMQTRAAKGLNAEFSLLVTGTPVENSLADFWCLMDTATPGLLSSYQDFRKKYIKPILDAASDEVDAKRMCVGRQLRCDTGVFMLRRIKEDNLKGLPSKTINVGLESSDNDWRYDKRLHSIMHGLQRDSYEAIILANNENDTNEALANLNRLRDVSLHPSLVNKGRLITSAVAKQAELEALINESSKLQSLLSILNSIRDKKEKCIIFLINKQLQQFLSIALGSLYKLGSLSVINGDTKTVDNRNAEKTRKGMIAEFEGKEGFNLIIMSPIAAGVGLTVIGANHAIHLERHWNPAKEAQASDRIYRIGQKKDVHIYIPILHHPEGYSFDVNLHKLLSKKTLLKDAVITIEQVLPEMPTARLKINRRLSANDLHKLSWEQFEALCAELFLRFFRATQCWLTNPGKDKGADVVLIKNEEIILIQCKHTKSGSYSGYRAIQEIKGAESFYADFFKKKLVKLLFITNAKKLSDDAIKLAKVSNVGIFTYPELTKELEMHTVELLDIYERLKKQRLQSYG